MQAPLVPPLIISSSDEEEWSDYRTMWEKLSLLERERAQTREKDGSPVVQSLRRESKAHKMSELKRMGDIMLSHMALLEGE